MYDFHAVRGSHDTEKFLPVTGMAGEGEIKKRGDFRVDSSRTETRLAFLQHTLVTIPEKSLWSPKHHPLGLLSPYRRRTK